MKSHIIKKISKYSLKLNKCYPNVASLNNISLDLKNNLNSTSKLFWPYYAGDCYPLGQDGRRVAQGQQQHILKRNR